MNTILESKQEFLNIITTVMNNKFELAKYYPDSDNMEVLLSQIDDLKQSLDSFRPLEGVHVEKLEKYFEEIYTYDSTTIEGNTLTLQETSLVLSKGITIGGKTLKEHFEIKNHADAIDYIKAVASNDEPFNKRVLLNIHHLILKEIDNANAGCYRNVEVSISGSKHRPPTFLQVDSLMDALFEFYETNKGTMNPVLLASEMHERLVTIHPFVDGNGRTSRLLMNLILLQHGYPITNISSENALREEYYKALESVQTGADTEIFNRFIAKNVKNALMQFLEMIAVNKEAGDKGAYFYKRILELSQQ